MEKSCCNCGSHFDSKDRGGDFCSEKCSSKFDEYISDSVSNDDVDQLINLAKILTKESTYIQDDWYIRCSYCHSILGGASSIIESHKDDCPTIIARTLINK